MPQKEQDPKHPQSPSRAGAACAALALLLACAPATPQEVPQDVWKRLSEREAGYLQKQLEQIRRWEGRPAGESPQPRATGALALLALASQGGPDAPKLREEGARYVAKALDLCTRWHTNQCARAQLPLERVALQYPQELPPRPRPPARGGRECRAPSRRGAGPRPLVVRRHREPANDLHGP